MSLAMENGSFVDDLPIKMLIFSVIYIYTYIMLIYQRMVKLKASEVIASW